MIGFSYYLWGVDIFGISHVHALLRSPQQSQHIIKGAIMPILYFSETPPCSGIYSLWTNSLRSEKFHALSASR
jgi:hypothetical protein